MTWWGWLLLSAYLLGYLIAIPRIGYVLANDLAFGSPNGGDVAMGLFLGALLAVVWPVLFPGYRWYQFAKVRGLSGAGLLVAPRPVRARKEQEQRERDLRARESHIRQLERELGVGR